MTRRKKTTPKPPQIEDIEGRARAAAVLALHVQELHDTAQFWIGYCDESRKTFDRAKKAAERVDALLTNEAERYKK